MIKQVVDVDGYWTVVVGYNVYLGDLDSGFTNTIFSRKVSFVGIGEASSAKQFMNTIAHEIKHVQSHICEYYNVPEYGEPAAYLTGYLTMKMFEVFKDLL